MKSLLQSYKGEAIKPLTSTSQRMPHLDIDDAFRFHIVFDEFEISRAYYDVFEAIASEILPNFRSIATKFSTLDEMMQLIAQRLARNDRKRHNATKNLPFLQANRAFARLINTGLLRIEPSRERRTARNKHQALKKSERSYKIQDKAHFTSHFARFYFRFIQPNLSLLENGEFNAVLQMIKDEFDEYASLGFELVCAEFLRKNGVKNVASFWHKNIEIDLLGICEHGIVVAEAKYRSKKICKNVLNLLLAKCSRLGIEPCEVVLFSRNGFSNELENLHHERVKLINLDQF